MMKAIKRFSLVIALVVTGAFGSETYAQWNTNASPPSIYYDDGSVAIGTNLPQDKLHVSGGGMILDPGSGSPYLYTGTGAQEHNRYLQLVNSPTLSWRSASGLKAGGILVADAFDFANPGKNDLIVKGKTGIGTATPKTKLDLGNSGGAMFVLNPGPTTAVNFTGFSHNDLIMGSWLTPADNLSNAFISTGYIQDHRRKFHIGSASSGTMASASFVPHFTVGAGGFVGIGAPNPRARLDLGYSGGAMMILNSGTTANVNFTGLEHNDMIMGSWSANGLANSFISIGYRDSPDRKFHIGTASSEVFASATFVPHFTMTAGGRVGIGTSDPACLLQITSSNNPTFAIGKSNTNTTGKSTLLFNSGNGTAANSFKVEYNKTSDTDRLSFFGGSGDEILTLKNAGGNVGIGVINPTHKLTVKGTVRSEEVIVEVIPNTGPDYVFERDYNLLPLSALEAYINQNKHLPEVPSAKEMEANGLKLMEMNLLLLKKVEELTLHVIEQHHEIKKVSDENRALKERMLKLESKKD